jgi:hypothetical protein
MLAGKAKDLLAYCRMLYRLKQICGLADNLKVNVILDSEKWYFYGAIDYNVFAPLHVIMVVIISDEQVITYCNCK